MVTLDGKLCRLSFPLSHSHGQSPLTRILIITHTSAAVAVQSPALQAWQQGFDPRGSPRGFSCSRDVATVANPPRLSTTCTMWHIPCLDRDSTGLVLTVRPPASGNLMRTSPRAAQATSQKPPTSSGFYVICCVAGDKKGWCLCSGSRTRSLSRLILPGP